MTVLNPDVWALSTDALHDPALARVANFLATGSNRGIIPAGPSSSGAVRPLANPTNRGVVLPFVAVAPSPWPGHFGEAYVWRSRTAQEFQLDPAPSSSERTDAIISRVWDPGVDSKQPPGESFFAIEVIPGVDKGIESADVLAAEHDLDYPFVWHGNVTLPPSQSEVNASRITDRRFQIGGQVWHAEHMRVGDLGTRTLSQRLVSEGVIFPSRGAQHALYIPDRAGEMKIRMKWLDIHYREGANSYGERWVQVGEGSDTINTHKYSFEAPARTDLHTTNWEVVDVLRVPPHWRGSTQRFEGRATLGTNAATDVVHIPEFGAVTLEVDFRETLD